MGPLITNVCTDATLLCWIELHPGLASWVQAIGSVGAIFAAVALNYWTLKETRRHAWRTERQLLKQATGVVSAAERVSDKIRSSLARGDTRFAYDVLLRFSADDAFPNSDRVQDVVKGMAEILPLLEPGFSRALASYHKHFTVGAEALRDAERAGDHNHGSRLLAARNSVAASFIESHDRVARAARTFLADAARETRRMQ